MSEELKTATAEPTTDGYAAAAGVMVENWPKNEAAPVATPAEPPTETSQKPGDEQVPFGSDSADEKSGAEGADQGEQPEQAAGPAVWGPSEAESSLAETYGISKEALQEFGSSAALNAALSLWDKQFSQVGREWLSGQSPDLEPAAPQPIPSVANPKEDGFSDEFGGDDADQEVIKQRDHYKAAYEGLVAQQQREQVEQRAQEARAAEDAVDGVFQEAVDLKELFGEGPRGKLSNPAHISARREIQQEMLAITAGRIRMRLQPLSVKDAFQRALYSVYGPQLQRKAAESAAAQATLAVTDSIKKQARDNEGRFTKPPLHRPATEVKSYEAAARLAGQLWGG